MVSWDMNFQCLTGGRQVLTVLTAVSSTFFQVHENFYDCLINFNIKCYEDPKCYDDP